MAELIMTEEGSNPSTPGSNKWKLFFKSDGLYIIDDLGTVIGPIEAGGGTWGGITGTLSDQADLDKVLNFAQGVGQNYIISALVTSNNLTIALKTLANTDPSTSDPVRIRIANTRRSVTAALSTTKNAGTNWCNAGGTELAAKPIDFFVYLIQEAGASAGTKIGFSRIPYARTMADFVNTSTNEKYIAGNWVNFNSTDEVENIGRFRAQLSASAAFNWSIVSPLIINRPIYDSGWLQWNPQYSASPSMTFTSVITDGAWYKVGFREVHVQLRAFGTTGGTASFEIRATAPFENYQASMLPALGGFFRDGSAFGAAYSFIGAATPDYIACERYDGSNFGLGTNRGMNVGGIYEI